MHVDHNCEAKVELPMESGETIPRIVACGIIALRQCTDCSGWFCGSEDAEHLIICVKCDGQYCEEHYQSHRLSRACEQMEEVA